VRTSILLAPSSASVAVLTRILFQQERSNRSTTRISSSNDSEVDLPSMSEEERMNAVRKLQKSFYSTTTVESATADAGGHTTPAVFLDGSTGIFHNLPLWRVDWVECPGRANCLNVHEGHYTHMFETILNKHQPWYFGHLTLPGGTTALRSTTSELRALELKSWREEIEDVNIDGEEPRTAVVGCLMKITDFRRFKDGRLLLLVHALERFVVEQPVRSFPYALANVQLLPDLDIYYPFNDDFSNEDVTKYSTARAKAVRQSLQYHNYEFSSTKLLSLPKHDADDKHGAFYLDTAVPMGSAVSEVLPFAFYADNKEGTLPDMSRVSSKTDDKTSSMVELSAKEKTTKPLRPLEQRLIEGSILQYPLSLSLLKPSESTDTNDCNVLEALLWLELEEFCRLQSFRLPEEILQLIPPALTSTLNMHVVSSRSSKGSGGALPKLSNRYPAQRRQVRLSYHVPAIIERTQFGAHLRDTLLKTPTTAARLRVVLEQFQSINEQYKSKF